MSEDENLDTEAPEEAVEEEAKFCEEFQKYLFFVLILLF